ncbi:MAG: hypothetical protein HFH56_06505 [Lachnospiraceae bacterium]|jgi:hypothetical protein|nr:hypothetical protein [Lachnospiraceae bacterium]
MTYKERPEWDASFWADRGYLCTVYKDLNRQIFDRTEQIHYQAHPVFLVEVAQDKERRCQSDME